ncbi:hypothetical protein IscW_ISCW009174, partial [Ixodes scapularis]
AASAPPRGRPPNRGDHPPAARHNRAQRIGRAEPFDACAVTRARRTPRRPLDARSPRNRGRRTARAGRRVQARA